MKENKKGQAMLVSHAILVGVSVALVLVVVFTLNGIRDDYQEFIAANEIEQACHIIKTGAEKIYRENKYLSASNTTYGSMRIVLPERIADLKYRTHFENRTLYVQMPEPLGLNSSCKLGLNVSFSGFTTGGVTEMTYTEFANGTRQIKFERVG